MALQEQTLFVPVGSLRQDVDEHVLGPGAGTLLFDNCVVDKQGRAVKRAGTLPLSSVSAPVGLLPALQQLAVHKGALLALPQVGDHPLAVYSPTLGASTYPANEVLRGPINVRSLKGYQGDGNGGYNTDMAVAGNYMSIGFCTATTGAFAANNYVQQIIDSASGHVVYTFTSSLSALAFMGHVVNVGAAWFVHAWLQFGGGGTVNFSRWNVATLAGIGTPTQVTAATAQGFSSGGSPIDLDLLVTGPDEVTAMWTRNDGTIWASKFTVSTATAGAAFQLKDSGGVALSGKCAQFVKTIAGAPSPTVLTASAGAGLKGHVYGAGLAANATTSTVIDAGATTTELVTGFSTSTGNYVALYEVPGSTAVLTSVKAATVVGGVVATGTFQTCGLASKAALMPDGQVYAVFRYPSTTQPAFYLMRVTTDPVTNVLPLPQARFSTWSAFFGQAVAVTKGQTLMDLPAFSGNVIGAFSESIRLEASGSSAAVTYDHGVTLRQLTMNDRTGVPKEAADCTFVPGGLLAAFDGQEYRDASFSQYPELTGVTYNNTGGGLVPGAVVQWTCIWKVIDAAGRVRRSGTAPVLKDTVPGGMNNATLTATTPRLSSAGGTVLLEVYRIPANGTTSFKVGSATAVTSGATVTFFDNVSDANLQTGEPLYAQGGVLAYQPAPPTFATWPHDSRLFAISAERRTELWFTSQFVPGLAPKWNEALIIDLDDQHGDMTGLASVIDGPLLIFKKRAVYALVGSGPDDNNTGFYQTPQIVVLGDGLAPEQVRSIVVTPEGVYYMSPRGLCRITRALAVEFIGNPIADETNAMLAAGDVITDAVHVPQLSQVRWYTGASGVFVWDYNHSVWSRGTNDNGALHTRAAVVVPDFLPGVGDGSSVVLIDGLTGGLYYETPASYQDRGANMSQAIRFPWLALAGLEGFERFWKVRGVGKGLNTNTPVQITMAYDHDVTNTQPVQQATPGLTWQWEARPKKPTAAALGLTVREASNNGPGFQCAGVAILWGAKKGFKPRPATQRAL